MKLWRRKWSICKDPIVPVLFFIDNSKPKPSLINSNISPADIKRMQDEKSLESLMNEPTSKDDAA